MEDASTETETGVTTASIWMTSAPIGDGVSLRHLYSLMPEIPEQQESVERSEFGLANVLLLTENLCDPNHCF